jgi:hypothetical protein
MELRHSHVDTPGYTRHMERTPQSDRWLKGWLLPYGIWTLADGTEVMFDRYYAAMWKRESKGSLKVTKADMNIWYPYVRIDYFANAAEGKVALKEWMRG